MSDFWLGVLTGMIGLMLFAMTMLGVAWWLIAERPGDMNGGKS